MGRRRRVDDGTKQSSVLEGSIDNDAHGFCEDERPDFYK